MFTSSAKSLTTISCDIQEFSVKKYSKINTNICFFIYLSFKIIDIPIPCIENKGYSFKSVFGK